MSLADIAAAFAPRPTGTQPSNTEKTEGAKTSGQFGGTPYSLAKSLGGLAKAIGNKRKPKSDGEVDSDADKITGNSEEADA